MPILKTEINKNSIYMMMNVCANMEQLESAPEEDIQKFKLIKKKTEIYNTIKDTITKEQLPKAMEFVLEILQNIDSLNSFKTWIHEWLDEQSNECNSGEYLESANGSKNLFDFLDYLSILIEHKIIANNIGLDDSNVLTVFEVSPEIWMKLPK